MKKKIILISSLLAVMLCGCGTETQATQTITQSDTQITTEQTTSTVNTISEQEYIKNQPYNECLPITDENGNVVLTNKIKDSCVFFVNHRQYTVGYDTVQRLIDEGVISENAKVKSNYSNETKTVDDISDELSLYIPIYSQDGCEVRIGLAKTNKKIRENKIYKFQINFDESYTGNYSLPNNIKTLYNLYDIAQNQDKIFEYLGKPTEQSQGTNFSRYEYNYHETGCTWYYSFQYSQNRLQSLSINVVKNKPD